MSYAACMAYFVNQNQVFGWYFLPLYPWLCAALAVSIVRASRRRMLGLSLLWCSVAWVTVASVIYSHQLIKPDLTRTLYLALLLVMFGAWTVSAQIAKRTIPVVNGVLVAGAAIACVIDVIYAR